MLYLSDQEKQESLQCFDKKTSKYALDNKFYGRYEHEKLPVELKDKFTITDSDDIPLDESINSYKDTYGALMQLGYHNRDIELAIQKITKNMKEIQTEDLIKLCLKELQ